MIWAYEKLIQDYTQKDLVLLFAGSIATAACPRVVGVVVELYSNKQVFTRYARSFFDLLGIQTCVEPHFTGLEVLARSS